MWVRLKPLLAVMALALALAVAAPAAGQQAPTLGAPETTESTAAPPPETDTDGNGGLKTWQEVLIFCAGLVLLAGIGFAIVILILAAVLYMSGAFGGRGGGEDAEPAGAPGAVLRVLPLEQVVGPRGDVGHRHDQVVGRSGRRGRRRRPRRRVPRGWRSRRARAASASRRTSAIR